MKKLLTLLAIVAFAGSAMAATSVLDKVTAKENQITSTIEANQKAREAKKAEAQQKQDAAKSAVSTTTTQVKTSTTAVKNAINSEKTYWKNTLK